jgi:hypothetical protein
MWRTRQCANGVPNAIYRRASASISVHSVAVGAGLFPEPHGAMIAVESFTHGSRDTTYNSGARCRLRRRALLVYSRSDPCNAVHHGDMPCPHAVARTVALQPCNRARGRLLWRPMHNIIPRFSATPAAFRRPAPAVGGIPTRCAANAAWPAAAGLPDDMIEQGAPPNPRPSVEVLLRSRASRLK